ncbi:tumor necrosis factor receptor superfamily member 10B [Echinops telfairi]|uniref:Tumor necrosis factor receptor superfamily member 10B n=1 Tax=Echinops telfairi TaxID=9371 RepID=A0AC55CTH3_ECHTE|nr:tumor necrosis factor receptor superfamily member 10B [Echinops telfairi]
MGWSAGAWGAGGFQAGLELREPGRVGNAGFRYPEVPRGEIHAEPGGLEPGHLAIAAKLLSFLRAPGWRPGRSPAKSGGWADLLAARDRCRQDRALGMCGERRGAPSERAGAGARQPMEGRGRSRVARRRSASKRISRKVDPRGDRGDGKSAEELGSRGAAGHFPRSRRLAGRVPGPPGAHLAGLKVPKKLLLILLLLVLLDSAELAPINHPDRLHSQAAAPQQLSLRGKCDPGFHLSASTGQCEPCKPGVEYTNVTNNFSSCLLCHSCDSDQVEIHPCTPTRDRECACNRGTYRDEDYTEMCEEGSPRKTGTKATEKARVSEEPVLTGLWSPTTASPPPSGTGPCEIVGIIGIVSGPVLVLALIYWCRRQGLGVVSRVVNRARLWWLCHRRGPGAGDNAHNESLNSYLSPMLNSELGMEGQQQAGVAGALEQIPVEGEPLREPSHAEGSPMGRMLLVPADDADPTETLH